MHTRVANPDPPHELLGWQVLPGAYAQTTLAKMARNIRASLRDPDVVETARRIIRNVPPRDCAAQAHAIRDWTDARFRFIRDPFGVELLETPAFHLARIRRDGFVQGDCDDAATITAALGMAVGLPASLHALAFIKKSAPFAHVVTFLHLPDGSTVDMDITHPKGRPHAPVSRELVRRV